ncbi:YhgE/Pip N-terminal domain protein [Cellulomonas flavigena DSM 20109]|uniref:YhgE/Pip N-terminal domain protein n=1 Tax=Cellulomonas flavigena (strain ATCC 482 / DSM 20109 / BCRC 11376 / JCM 18109 / NBRC 3775 / NCIMB 8073 / NRS 134) TaxID=446466 RepID=D5UL38_CELFN|nr:YhgE/Pip family protein [Cellulomonas flavigena]ADG75920.1 YhgE/Pip N-terminal domain protein [Cellulomonas flavigena DSM 20109]
MSRTSVNPRPVRRWPAVVVALAAPLALVVVLLAAAWAPADGLPRVQAAIVNQDEPVTLEGQYTPLGRQLAGALVEGAEVDSNYAWVVTDEAGAAAGIDDGTYAAVVTIPENFSAAATSFASGDDVEQATIEITTLPGATAVDQAVAATVTTTATRVLGAQLTTTYVENVLVGFTTLSDSLGDAADGAVQLADGAGQLADGTQQLADGTVGLADGVAELHNGTGQLRSGSYELATGTRQLAGGARQLAGGARELADGAGRSAAGARELATGAGGLAAGTSQLAGGLAATSAGVSDTSRGLPALAAGADDLATNLSGVAAGVRPLVDGALAKVGSDIAALSCTAESADETCRTLIAQRAQLVALRDGLGPLSDGARELADGIAAAVNGTGTPENPGLVVGLQQLAGGAAELDAGAQKLAGGAGQLADGLGQLAGGANGLADGASSLAGGVSQLADGTSELAAGVARLDGGVGQLADGSRQLADGTAELTSGAVQLADGTAQLGDGLGQAVDQLPTTPEDQRADLARVVTAPVAAPATAVSAPLGLVSTLVAVALWVGALVLFLVFRPLPVRVAGSTRSAFALAAGALALPVAVSAVAGAGVGVLAGGITGQDAVRVVGLALVGAVGAVALAAFQQAVAAWFGTAGRVVAVVAGFAFLVAGLAATVPAWVGSTVAWLPLSAVSDGIGAVVGESPASLLGAVVGLALWGVASLLATTGAAARARQAVGPRTVTAYA